MDRNTARRASVELPVVSVSMNDEIGAVPVDNFCQARSSKKRRNLWRFAFNRCCDRCVMQYDHALSSSQLRHGPFEFQSLIDRSPDEGLNFRFAKRG